MIYYRPVIARVCMQPLCRPAGWRPHQKDLQNKGKSHTFGGALLSMRLHSHMRIQVIQSSVRLFAAVPSALVHALNLLIAAARSLVLLRPRNRDKRVDLQSNPMLATWNYYYSSATCTRLKSSPSTASSAPCGLIHINWKCSAITCCAQWGLPTWLCLDWGGPEAALGGNGW